MKVSKLACHDKIKDNQSLGPKPKYTEVYMKHLTTLTVCLDNL